MYRGNDVEMLSLYVTYHAVFSRYYTESQSSDVRAKGLLLYLRSSLPTLHYLSE